MDTCSLGWGVGVYAPVRIPIKIPCKGYYLRWWYNGWHYWFFLPGEHRLKTEGENYRTYGTRVITVGSGQITLPQVNALRTIMLTREVYLWTNSGWKNTRIDPGSIMVYTNQVGYEFEINIIIGSKEITLTSGFSPVADVPEVIPNYVACEVTIGNQVWLCKNYDIDFPGSKVYDNDEANRAIYGGLYTWAQIMSPGFCPPGWRVPTLDDLNELIAFAGGVAVAGGHLKKIGTTEWNSPNTDATDTYGFAAVGPGYAYIDLFTRVLSFANFNNYLYLWASDDISSISGRCVRLAYDSAGVVETSGSKLNAFLSVRLIKNTPPVPFTNRNADVTGWTPSANWDIFNNIGNNITSAISTSGLSAYCNTNYLAVTAGDKVEISFDLSLNAGIVLQLYIWDVDNLVVITGTNVVMSNGLNTVQFIIPGGCTQIYCSLINIINFAPPPIDVDFSLTMP